MTSITTTVIDKARKVVDAVTFDDSGFMGQGGHGGLLSRDTIRTVDELRIALAVYDATGGWYDIATAPKDGTFVLCVHASGHQNILQWVTVDIGWGAEGRWRGRVDDMHDWKPTHWMPLPGQPPAEKRNGS